MLMVNTVAACGRSVAWFTVRWPHATFITWTGWTFVLMKALWILLFVLLLLLLFQRDVIWWFGLVANIVGCINEGYQHWPRLALEWVTVRWWLNHLGMKLATQVNSAWPSVCG